MNSCSTLQLFLYLITLRENKGTIKICEEEAIQCMR